jgi:hypothetical protein
LRVDTLYLSAQKGTPIKICHLVMPDSYIVLRKEPAV